MTTPTPSAAIGCIDHVIIVVDDLDRDAATFRRLGFTLSPKGVHSAAMGSANHTIMLQRDYFELLSVLAPTERNARWRQALDEGGGVAGVALTTQDPAGAYAHWQAQGLSPKEAIDFSREVIRADGVRMEARFQVVSLPEVPQTGVRIFVCSQPTRDAVWLPELMDHANTANAIDRVTLACADPAGAAAQWRRVVPVLGVEETPDGVMMATGPHRIELIRDDVAKARFGQSMTAGQTRGLGIAYRVGNLDACRSTLAGNGVPFTEQAGALVVAASAAGGVNLRFEQG